MITPNNRRLLSPLRTILRTRCLYSLLIAVLCLACTSSNPAQPPAPNDELSGSIRIVGTDTMKELMDRWIAAFTALHPAVHIELVANGALTAAPALADGSADLAPLGREFTPAELAVFRSTRTYNPTGIPVALGSYDVSGRTVALAIFVNQNNPIARLNFQQLDAIFCTSLRRGSPQSITTWGKLGLGSEWTTRPIHPIGVNFPDGISNFIRLRICNDGELRTNIHTEHTGGPVNVLERIVTDVAANPAAIGYAGFANLKPGAKIIAISEASGPYLSGTRAEVASADYPLTRFIYIFVDRRPREPIPTLERAFLSYVIGPEGQSLVDTDKIYMPLPEAIASHELKKLRQAAPN
jgi:phosphate transport system substrate-binding protein